MAKVKVKVKVLKVLKSKSKGENKSKIHPKNAAVTKALKSCTILWHHIMAKEKAKVKVKIN